MGETVKTTTKRFVDAAKKVYAKRLERYGEWPEQRFRRISSESRDPNVVEMEAAMYQMWGEENTPPRKQKK